MISVSIIVPVYNVEKYIERCLQSVVGQTYRQIECIVVNDCTPDRSFEIAKSFVSAHAADNSNVSFVLAEHEQNKGLSEARNTGIRKATGNYVFFLDSDDAITPTAIADLVTTAEENGRPDIVYGETVTIGAEGRKQILDPERKRLSPATNRDVLLGCLNDCWPRIACNKIVRRSIFTEQDIWFYPGILHEDEMWSFEVATAINAMVFCPKVTYLYYIGDTNSITRSKGAGERHFRDNITILERKVEYIPKVSCPEEVAQSIYNLCHQFWLSLIVLRMPRKFRNECRKRLTNIIKAVKAAGNWKLHTSMSKRIAWWLVR